MLEEPRILGGIGDGWKEISIMCSKSQYGKMLGVVKKYCQKYGWEYQSNKIDDDVFEIIVSEWDESTLTDDYRESTKKFGRKFVKESYHGRVKVEASIIATGRTAEEALELLHNRLLDADAKITDENEKPNPEIVDKYNYWFDENMGDVDFDICRDNNSNGFIQMDIKAI